MKVRKLRKHEKWKNKTPIVYYQDIMGYPAVNAWLNTLFWQDIKSNVSKGNKSQCPFHSSHVGIFTKTFGKPTGTFRYEYNKKYWDVEYGGHYYRIYSAPGFGSSYEKVFLGGTREEWDGFDNNYAIITFLRYLSAVITGQPVDQDKRLYIAKSGEGLKCGGCNWETFNLYVIASSQKEAEDLCKKDGGSCGNCIADYLVESETELNEKI